MIKLYNTLTRKVEEFKPIEEGKVRLYTCGLTVYGEPHVGNWSSYIRWDILVRTLRANGYDVKHVQNITDVGHLTDDEDAGEDKLAKAAKSKRTTAWEIAKRYIKSAEEGRKLLSITEPTFSPKATEYIQQQINMVKDLEAKGYTYKIEGDGVYFDTSKLDDYGAMARLDIEGLQSGARVANVGKKSPTDFALWKFSKPNEKRDMEWDSPWGVGFPGWHLECSVMALDLLGDQLDIHTGGVDHINVHHTNEIAQSESVTGKKFSNFWLHANHMKMKDEKMSKSLGNVFTLKDVLDRGYSPDVFRLLVLESHYRNESLFTWQLMDSAKARLKRWQALADLRWQLSDNDVDNSEVFKKATEEAKKRLDDDLDTPGALSALEKAFSELETNGANNKSKKALNDMLTMINNRLGLELKKDDIITDAKKLIEERLQARKAGDYDKSDKIRDELLKGGISLNDTQDKTTWYRA